MGEFIANPLPITALQWDGSEESATGIAAWVNSIADGAAIYQPAREVPEDEPWNGAEIFVVSIPNHGWAAPVAGDYIAIDDEGGAFVLSAERFERRFSAKRPPISDEVAFNTNHDRPADVAAPAAEWDVQ